jgi:nucleotide-binding universal stress UspA family protein
MFKTILAATDQVILRDTPATAALELSHQYRSDLQILHVLESASTTNRRRIKHYLTGIEEMASRPYCAEVRTRLRRTYPDRGPSPSAVMRDVAVGLPWLAIVERARHIRADLIVLGPHSGHADARGVVRVEGPLGSTVEGVVMRAPCPVMIVNRTLPAGGAVFKRILVGVDFSAACECAVCFAVQAAQPSDAHIHVFHMIPIPPYPKYSRGDYEDDKHRTRERTVAFGAAYLEGMAHTCHVWGGVLPADELLLCARNVDADLIVLGSHTRERNGKWYAGSVVERVGLRARCPVITINAPEALQPWKKRGAALRQAIPPVDRRLSVFGRRTHR